MRTIRGRREGFRVSPLSEGDIQIVAQNVRDLFYPIEHCYLDIVRIIEHKLHILCPRFHLEIVQDSSLPGREAEFDPEEWTMRVCESIYAAACNQDGHCRGTLAHELGHFFLHRFQKPTFGREDTDETIPYYLNSEWQADTFARHLLVPKHLAMGMTTEAIMVSFEVSRKLASIVSGNRSVCASRKQENRESFLPGINWGLC